MYIHTHLSVVLSFELAWPDTPSLECWNSARSVDWLLAASVQEFSRAAWDPKVQVPFKVDSGQTPRRLEIERRKRHYASQDIRRLLRDMKVRRTTLLNYHYYSTFKCRCMVYTVYVYYVYCRYTLVFLRAPRAPHAYVHAHVIVHAVHCSVIIISLVVCVGGDARPDACGRPHLKGTAQLHGRWTATSHLPLLPPARSL